MPSCQVCGQENPAGFRFCGACGAELTEAVPVREQRKTVTVLFCDVTGSTALGEQLDPESLRRTMGRYFDELRRIVERHGGLVEKFIGDAVMAVFGIPRAHEDDALRAVRAAAEIRERMASLGAELGLTLAFRTGVNTGEVVAGEGETLVTGDAVNVAARLEQAAGPDEILIGGGTLALVRDAVVTEAVEPLEVKGKRAAVTAHRIISVDATAQAFVRRLDRPLVGRVSERERLRADFDAAVSEHACHLFTVLGPAGVGKSRLVAEFLSTASDDADVLHGQCLHYGDDITYWPLVEILLAIGVDLDSVIGSSPADTQLAFRKLLEARAESRPQIVMLDDIQWAEGAFLDLVEHVADWSRDAPIFLLCVARPELLEERPGWGGGKLNATTVLLEPLNSEDCDALMDMLADDLSLEPDVRDRILVAADGNPLFLEEMVAMVAEGGDRTEVVVPPTIQALLQARLDRLGAAERDVIGCGAVEGQTFHRGVVQELAPAANRENVPAHLLSLVRKEVIRPDRPTYTNDDAFRFRHLLIRDAAYDALPKETRAELHERFADWLERRADLVELDEIVGYHLEQAHANRAALDASDTHLDELARRAAGRLRDAGRGALNRGDLDAARGLLGRAVALLPPGDPQRLDVLRELAWPQSQAGSFDEIRTAIGEFEASDEVRFQAFAEAMRMELELATGAYTDVGGLDRLAEIRQTAEAIGDDLGLAWVEFLTFSISWNVLRAEEGRAALLRGARHADRAGQTALASVLRSWEGATLVFGPTPVDQAIPQTEAEIARARGTIGRSGLRRLARLLACRGEFDAARASHLEGMRIAREAGLLREAAASTMGMAFIERRAGDLAAAEAELREAVEELDGLGDRGFYSTVVSDLAEVLIHRGEDEEAAEWCARARETTGPTDLATLSHVEALEGHLAARRGDCAEGESKGRRAVEMLDESDFYDRVAGARMLLARTLIVCGKHDEARDVASEALAIYEAKGDAPASEWARELLATPA